MSMTAKKGMLAGSADADDSYTDADPDATLFQNRCCWCMTASNFTSYYLTRSRIKNCVHISVVHTNQIICLKLPKFVTMFENISFVIFCSFETHKNKYPAQVMTFFLGLFRYNFL